MPAQVLFLNPVRDANLNSLVARNAEILGIGGDLDEETWHSRDGGATWSYRRSSRIRGQHEHVTLAPDGRLCSSSSKGHEGARWAHGPGLPRWQGYARDDGLSWSAIAMDEQGTLWRGGQRSAQAGCGVLAYSTDGGATWTRVRSTTGEFFPFCVDRILCRGGKAYVLHGKGISVCTRAGTERTWLPNIGFLRGLSFAPSGAMLLIGETGARAATSADASLKQVRVLGSSVWGFRQGTWVEGIGFVLTAVTGVYTSDATGQVWSVARDVQPALDAARGKKATDAFGAVTPLSAGRALVGTLQGDLVELRA